MNDKLKMYQVLEIQQERGTPFGQWLMYNEETNCWCAMGAIIEYYHPGLDVQEYNETLAREMYDYPEYPITVYDRIYAINDSATTTSFQPVIDYLKSIDK